VIAREIAPVPEPPADLDELAVMAADLAEQDDVWFARAQWLVRRAILARAETLGLAIDDAFWLPLEELATETIDPVVAARRASGARTAAARAARWNMPISVGASTEPSGVALRGIGIGGSVTGRVVRLGALATTNAVSRGDIVVTRAVTPALAVIVIGCAGIVSETGGPLDHGAAMARELGIPCVVGCRDACTRLTDGMIVTIDGDDVRVDR
jgi:phosphohistidine swiveling domain-containing protein